MRKQFLLTLIASLVVSACATDDGGDTRAAPPPAKKRAGNVEPATSTPPKARRSNPPLISPGAPLDGIVIQHRNRANTALIATLGGGLDRSNAREYMAQLAEDLQRALQSDIEQGDVRVEQRAGDHAIRISMTPSSGFDNLSSVVKPSFLATLSRIVPDLNQYDKTLLTVMGYIEKAGPDAGNQQLAERRAKSVSDYFISRNVEPLRLQSYARIDPQAPVAGGDNPPKRRVELWIQPMMAK